MDLKTYQAEALKTAIYPKENAVAYAVLGIVGEAGEIANKVKKILRGDKNVAELKEQTIAEIGDVMWYLAALAHELDTDLSTIASDNIKKLHSRYERGLIKGAGDQR